MNKHTPIPWSIYKTTDIKSENGNAMVAATVNAKDAELIVNAVNSYQATKEALEAIVARMDGVFDNPSLIKQGPLSIGHGDDIRRIAKKALILVNRKEEA